MEKKSKKILYIITKSVWAGASKYVYDLAISLPQAEFRPTAAAGSEPSLSANYGVNGQKTLFSKLKEKNIPYFEIKSFQRDVNILKDIFAFFEILSLLYKIKPDIIHVSSAKAGGISGIAVFIYKLLSTRYSLLSIFTVHGWTFNENRPNWQIFLIKNFSRLTCLFYDKIICVSEYDKQTAIKNKICNPKKIIVIHNGIKLEDYNFFSREDARNLLRSRTPKSDLGVRLLTVGSIGEFTKNKGQSFLVKAIKSVSSSQYPVVSILIGFDGGDISNLKSQISKLKLENKIFLVQNLPDAAQYLKAFDIFVLPSIKEGLPYVLLEASLAGLPIITTNTGGIPEIIQNEENGILIESKNPEQIANALKKLFENPELKNKLGENARKQVLEKFGFEKMMKETMKIYNQ